MLPLNAKALGLFLSVLKIKHFHLITFMLLANPEVGRDCYCPIIGIGGH